MVKRTIKVNSLPGDKYTLYTVKVTVQVNQISLKPIQEDRLALDV